VNVDVVNEVDVNGIISVVVLVPGAGPEQILPSGQQPPFPFDPIVQ
jgi:hypothetical protein